MTVIAQSRSGTASSGLPPTGRESHSASRARYRASPEGEARILLLIDQFSRTARGKPRHLEGRVKLAKLDFFLRYPRHLRRVLEAHGARPADLTSIEEDDAPLDARMMRYRYGPWDPSYYAILGSLVGRGLVELTPLSTASGLGFRTTRLGASLAETLREDESFAYMAQRLRLLGRYLDKSGNTLKGYIYELPEVADAEWNEELG